MHHDAPWCTEKQNLNIAVGFINFWIALWCTAMHLDASWCTEMALFFL